MTLDNKKYQRKYIRICLSVIFLFPALSFMLFIGSVKQVVARGCPIVFDLNGNGKIDITGHNSSEQKLYTVFTIGDYVDFDIFADGNPIKIEWIKPNTDGILVHIPNGIPREITGKHLFGQNELFRNGFDKLKTFDHDKNGEIEGDEFDGISIWKDNGDAKMQPSEILQISELKIRSLLTEPRVVTGEYGLPKLIGVAMSPFVKNSDNSSSSSPSDIYIEDVWFMTSDQPLPIHSAIANFL